MSACCTIYVTCSDHNEALEISRTLVREKLAACANIMDGMTSVFVWDGEVCEEKESVLLLKTLEAKREKAIARIIDLHSYEVPCVTVWPINGGNPAYLKWVEDSLSGK
ncbi:divalent-cation tolerance protein CutA [Emcibacter nanhaiensis]|uniref:Divalent-cation tolerance protein CutA n=1 Tax=Emcibacter nanhaiensis TaxID=1505037 RepID=A0A501PRH2_9PROT|nr:divalent-cation tolerance protein CutA [Emcibacter nanhaiensis]TPD62758.1 divalent-cation tolerance protein CutA [Emcibacter nanhaiensis]